MLLSIIVAASENNVIGIGNQMPWHLKEDLRFFKDTTMGHPVIMGRKTWESLGKKPLAGRRNMIITSDPDIAQGTEAEVFPDISAAMDALWAENTEKAFIIGGGYLYHTALPLVDEIYLTRIHTEIEHGETFFPEIRDDEDWELESTFGTIEKNDHHPYSFTFEHWIRL